MGSARQKFPELTKGLNVAVSPLAGDLGESPSTYDVTYGSDILQQRFGYNILDLEPSHTKDSDGTGKGRLSLDFDGVNDKAVSASFTGTLGIKWSLRWDCAFAIGTVNNTDGTRVALHIPGASQDPLKISLIGVSAGSTIQVQVVVKDSQGNSVTLTSAARTTTAWTAAGPYGSARFIRITRDGATVSLYIAETLEDSDTLSSAAYPSQPATGIYVGCDSSSANFAQLSVFSSLVLVNRVLASSETYFPITWPTDEQAESDVLGNWQFHEATGTTVEDFSLGGTDLTVTGATWTLFSNGGARGLGIHTHRRTDGSRYYAVACGRRSTSSASASPSGAVYLWKATQAFTPFYFGGDPANDDATANLSGLNFYARMQFLSVANDLYFGNGKDWARNYGGTTPALAYWGITAPATAPVCAAASAGGAITGGTYSWVYSYYNSNTGVESGRSPSASQTVTAGSGNYTVVVSLFGSSDTQVTHIRVYRTLSDGATTYVLVGEVANGTEASFADDRSDANIANNIALPGADASGNGLVKRLYYPGGPTSGLFGAQTMLAWGDQEVIHRAGNTTGLVPTVADTADAGNVNAGVHYYAYSWYSSTTGQETGMSPAASLTAAGSKTALLTKMSIPDKSATIYDQWRFYRTKAGKREWFLLDTATWSTSVGTELAPALTNGNWTVGAGWESPIVGPGLIKNADGTGTQAPNPALTIVAGCTYKVVITLSAHSVGTATYTLGSTAGRSVLGAATTYTDYVVATDTANLVITPTNTSRFTISAISIKKVQYTDNTADSSLSTTIETYGLPPRCRYAVLFANRVWFAGDPLRPGSLYWTTAGDYQNVPLLNEHIANAGAEITALVPSEGMLWVHYNDGRIYGVPHPGIDPDIKMFVTINMKEMSARGAAISHYSVQRTPFGLIWLGQDAFYSIQNNQIKDVSPTLTPSFLNLNRVRGKYACSMYIEDEKLYLCWVSRANARLNEEAFVLDCEKGAWNIWRIHADAAGILTDPNEKKHYCFLVENGVLCELDPTSDSDGDGSGTLSSTVVDAGITRFKTFAGRTAPTGGDGGYPVWFRKSDGSSVLQRWKLDPALQVSGLDFYPPCTNILSGTWTVYFHGIQMDWTSMQSQFSDSRPDKTFQNLFIYHGKETTGALAVRSETDEGDVDAATLASVSLTDDMTSQVSLQKAGRCLQLRITHDPPKADEPVRIVELEVEGSLAGDTP